MADVDAQLAKDAARAVLAADARTDSAYQIVQVPGHVVIVHEILNSPR